MSASSILFVRSLSSEDADDVVKMIADDDPEYRLFFSGLAADTTIVRAQIAEARRDAYWGIWKSSDELSAIFMLRGLDAGYAAPAFGVYVRAADSGCGLARLAMQHALCHCRLHSIPEMMLTVDEDNPRARDLYERMGFVRTEEISPKGQPIFRRKTDV